MSEENNIIPQEEVVSYDDDNIRHLSDMVSGRVLVCTSDD